MFAPGVPDVMKDFHSSSPELASFVVSVYLLGYCFGPLLLAPLSEMYGRLPIYHACNVLYIIWSVACALTPNLASLIIFRLFAGLAGSCPLTVGPASFADMIPQEKRGTAMSIWALGSLIGPVVGPIGMQAPIISSTTDSLSLTVRSGWIYGTGYRVALDILGACNCGTCLETFCQKYIATESRLTKIGRCCHNFWFCRHARVVRKYHSSA